MMNQTTISPFFIAPIFYEKSFKEIDEIIPDDLPLSWKDHDDLVGVIGELVAYLKLHTGDIANTINNSHPVSPVIVDLTYLGAMEPNFPMLLISLISHHLEPNSGFHIQFQINEIESVLCCVKGKIAAESLNQINLFDFDPWVEVIDAA